MERKIAQYSYWLGIICVVVAIAWRAANALGYFLAPYIAGQSIYYMSFYKGALIFLLVCIASGAYISAGKERL